MSSRPHQADTGAKQGKVTGRMTRDASGDLCGVYEAAEILGVKSAQVSRWLAKGQVMPALVARLRATPVWSRATAPGSPAACRRS